MIIKEKDLLEIFDSLTKKEQDKVVAFLLNKSNTKLHVYDFKMQTIMITSSFYNAFDKAFLQSNRGHFQTNSSLTFSKISPSIITNTISHLFILSMEHLNITPNALHKELVKQKLIEDKQIQTKL